MPTVITVETEFYVKYYAKLSDPLWLSEITGETVTAVEITTPVDAGGHHATVFSLRCTITPSATRPSSTELKLIVKLLGQGNTKQGFEREIEVYQRFLQPLNDKGLINTPKFYFGDHDPIIGAKIVVLEELDAVHCGRFFGHTSPHNIGKDLVEMTKDYPGVTDVLITAKGFAQVAKLHAAYWQIPKSEIPACINGGDWLFSPDQDGKAAAAVADPTELSPGEKQYNEMVGYARATWPLRHTKRTNVTLNKYLEDIVTHSLETTTFESFSKNLNSRPHTIIHSDFYPANSLVEYIKDPTKDEDHCKVYLIDFEVISIGAGPQDLAQWMISHVNPVTRKENEMELLGIYYQTLQTVWKEVFGEAKAEEFKSAYPFSMVLEDYINGVGKWIWLLCVCAGLTEGIPDHLYQHFIDQMTDFLQTFDVSIEKGNVPEPRS